MTVISLFLQQMSYYNPFNRLYCSVDLIHLFDDKKGDIVFLQLPACYLGFFSKKPTKDTVQSCWSVISLYAGQSAAPNYTVTREHCNRQ